MLIVDSHVHMGQLDDSAPQRYEDIAPIFDEAGVTAAVCISPVQEIYDRYDPDFVDTPAWQERRRQSREYLCSLKDKRHRIYPFYFVWNDFDTSGLDRYCGIKWHRHPDEPRYHYDDPACARMIDAIRDRGFVVLLEEEWENTVRFVDEFAPGVPVIIPHLGRLNGGVERFFREDFWRRENTHADMSAADCQERDIQRYLEKYGPERMLFGSDYPFGSSVISKEKIDALNLPEADRKLIFADNILRLLKHTEQYEKP